jgi:hypothetical protein
MPRIKHKKYPYDMRSGHVTEEVMFSILAEFEANTGYFKLILSPEVEWRFLDLLQRFEKLYPSFNRNFLLYTIEKFLPAGTFLICNGVNLTLCYMEDPTT